METRIGSSGFVYVLNARGATRGQYVISKDGARDGEDIWEARDSDGQLMFQEICALAEGLASGEIGEHEYRWQNPAARG